MRHGTLLSSAILFLLAALPSGAMPSGGQMEVQAPVAVPSLPATFALEQPMGGGRYAVRLLLVAEDGLALGLAARSERSGPAEEGQVPGAVPTRPMVIAVAGRGTPGHSVPLGITVVPAPHPPARAVSVLISGLPPGVTLSRGKDRGAGAWSISLTNAEGLWSAGLMDLDDLSLKLPPGYSDPFELKVTALAMHGEIGMKSEVQSLSVAFAPPPVAVGAVAKEPPAPVTAEGKAEPSPVDGPTVEADPGALSAKPTEAPPQDERPPDETPPDETPQATAPSRADKVTIAAPTLPARKPDTLAPAPAETRMAALGKPEPSARPSRPDRRSAAGIVRDAKPPGSAATLPEDLVMRRGDALFAQGDLAGARLFYEFGLAAGSGRAAFALARTYDPLVHRRLGVRGAPPDPELAAHWYRRAMAAGNAEAGRRLQDMTAWLDAGR